MVFAIFAGTVVSVLSVLLVAAYHRAPTRQRCPQCERPTAAVQIPRWIRMVDSYVTRRWCPECAWEGVGRTGPEFEPGNPVAHDSGFRFGEDSLGPNLGFAWRHEAVADAPMPPPDHPSGFRFAPKAVGSPPRRVDHPSGFEWSRGAVRGPVFMWRPR